MARQLTQILGFAKYIMKKEGEDNTELGRSAMQLKELLLTTNTTDKKNQNAIKINI